MHNLKVLIVMVAGLALLAACNETPADAPVADAGLTTPVADSHAGHDHAPGEGHGATLEAAPSEITLDDGSTVKVIAVAALNADPKAYAGTYAIDGTIGDVFADKGKFMLKDCGVVCGDASCAGCEADQQLPVSFDLASLKGELPAKEARVHVVADIKLSEAGGFTLAVKEVREAKSGKAVCTCGHDHGDGHDHAGHDHDDHAHEGHDHAGHDDHGHDKKAKDGSSQA